MKPRLWRTVVVVLLIALIIVYLDNRNLNKMIDMIDASQQRIESTIQDVIDIDALSGDVTQDESDVLSGDMTQQLSGDDELHTPTQEEGLTLSGIDSDASLEGEISQTND